MVQVLVVVVVVAGVVALFPKEGSTASSRFEGLNLFPLYPLPRQANCCVYVLAIQVTEDHCPNDTYLLYCNSPLIEVGNAVRADCNSIASYPRFP